MSNKEFIEKDGVVIETLPNGMFKVKLDEDQREVNGYLSGKIRRYNIKVLLGDKVKLEFSKYDLDNGRITYRYK